MVQVHALIVLTVDTYIHYNNLCAGTLVVFTQHSIYIYYLSLYEC